MGKKKSDRERLLKMLAKHKPKDLIETEHARFRREFRRVSHKQIVSDLLGPGSLRYAKEQPITEPRFKKYKKKGYRKFLCYFSKNREVITRYVISLNSKIFIITVLPIIKRWQRNVKKSRGVPI